MKIRIVLVDDHKTLRAGLRFLLEAHEDLQLVGEAECISSAVSVIQSTMPDVLVLDLGLPDGNGLELLPQLSPECNARILVFSAFDGREWAERAVAAGCAGYVDKTAGCDEIVAAIRAVHAGRTVISVADRTSIFVQDAPHGIGSPTAAKAALSEREREVLGCLARGLTNQEAANELFLSVKTIETYRSRLSRKLGMRGRAELFQYAQSVGLICRT